MNNSNTKEEIVFADGFKFRRKHANAPDFVLGSLSIKVDDAISFLKENQREPSRKSVYVCGYIRSKENR